MANLDEIEEVEHALAKPNEERAASGGIVEVEKSRAIQEVQAMFVMARKFPRDEIAAETAIMKACERYSFAEKARYKYKKGGEVIGLTIRAAEMVASAWGNLRYGWREVSRSRGFSDVEAMCWDLESNVQSFRQFRVEHSMKANDRIKFLTDPRDIYEHIANQAQRRQRACILERIPYEIRANALEKILATILKGLPKAGPELMDRVKKAVLGFDKIGVKQEHLEGYIGHSMDIVTAAELADLLAIFNAIDKEGAKREDYFDIGPKNEGGPAGDLKDRIRGNGETMTSMAIAKEDLLPFEKK